MVCSFPGTTQTRFPDFPDAMNSFNIVLWYTYTCSNIKLNGMIKLVLLKLRKMTTNAEYVVAVLKNLKTTSTQERTCVLHLTERHMISINLEKICYASVFLFVCLFCFRNDCRVNTCIYIILKTRQQCI